MEAIAKVEEAAKANATSPELLALILSLQKTIDFPNEFKYYILMCGLFSPERHIIKSWSAYEEVFLQLVQADGDLGIKHFM